MNSADCGHQAPLVSIVIIIIVIIIINIIMIIIIIIIIIIVTCYEPVSIDNMLNIESKVLHLEPLSSLLLHMFVRLSNTTGQPQVESEANNSSWQWN